MTPRTASPLDGSARCPFGVVTGKVAAGIVGADLSGCIAQVGAAYLAHEAGRSTLPHSVFLRFADRPEARIIALPAHLAQPWQLSGLKWIASFPHNVADGLPRASAVLVLNGHDSGFPFACMEASVISAARTAASAVLAARHLSATPGRIGTLAVVGTGLIARSVHRFLAGTGWTIGRLLLNDLDADRASAFAAHVRDLSPGQRVDVTGDLASALADADAILFATVAGAPHVHDPALFGHAPLVLHLSLRDLAAPVILAAHNIVDDVDHALRAGTSLELAEQACGHRRFVAGTLAQVMQGAAERAAAGKPTIFSPFGLGVLDLAVGKWIYDEALRRGQVVTIEDFFPDDAW